MPLEYRDGALVAIPTRADLTKDQEERERLWREMSRPVYSTEDGTFEAWQMPDLKHRPEPNWLIDYVVEEDGLTVFFAGDKLGKTAVISSMLWGWTAGHDHFLDETFKFRDPSDGEPRKVLYVLLEGTGTYYRRFDAWQRRFADDETTIPYFWVSTTPVQLWKQGMDLGDADTWAESLQELADAIATFRPHILVIDTFARATPGVDENSSQLGAVVGALDHLRNAYGVATILVHHTPVDNKMKRPRGWSGLKAAASSYVWIEGDQDEKVKQFCTGPHRNADFTNPVSFVTKSFADAFVVEASAPTDTIQNETRLRILHTLQEQGGWMKRSDLDFGEKPSTTTSHLKELELVGLVEHRQDGQSYLWRAKDELEEL